MNRSSADRPSSLAPRRIAVATVGRSDYGILRPLLTAIEADPRLDLQLIVGAAHLVRGFGSTADEIARDGFVAAAEVDCSLAADRPGSIARAMGLATMGFARAYEEVRPDIVVLLGDRYEMHAAACAAVPFLLPLAHIGGGSTTRGAIDDVFRNSITKLSHIHFCETDEFARQLRAMGETPERIHLTGALGLDNLAALPVLPPAELAARFGCIVDPAPILVTFHPETRAWADTEAHVAALIAALEAQDAPIVFTYPNADTAGQVIIREIEAFARRRPDRVSLVPHFGTAGYFSMMRHARAMVGNSSSGIIEAASFHLPVVDIGRRQEGRLSPRNVIHVAHDAAEIVDGLARATSEAFRRSLDDLVNPYGQGNAAQLMTEVLARAVIDDALVSK